MIYSPLNWIIEIFLHLYIDILTIVNQNVPYVYWDCEKAFLVVLIFITEDGSQPLSCNAIFEL